MPPGGGKRPGSPARIWFAENAGMAYTMKQRAIDERERGTKQTIAAFSAGGDLRPEINGCIITRLDFESAKRI